MKKVQHTDGKTTAAIQTKIWDEDLGKWIWKDCEHKNWAELVKDGWELAYLDANMSDGPVVCLKKNGYLNEFRNTPIRYEERQNARRSNNG